MGRISRQDKIATSVVVAGAAVAFAIYAHSICLFSRYCPIPIPSGGLKIGTGQVNAMPFSGGGWSGLEKIGIWSVAPKATLTINCAGATAVVVSFWPYAAEAMDVALSINGTGLISKQYPPATKAVTETLPIPKGATACELGFSASPLQSPSDHGGSDKRRLGVMLQEIRLTI